VNRHLEESERALQERVFKLEGQRIQLEEVRVESRKDRNTYKGSDTGQMMEISLRMR